MRCQESEAMLDHNKLGVKANFRLFGRIHPKNPGPTSLPKEYMASKANTTTLNGCPLYPHGHGPFCRLVPPKLPTYFRPFTPVQTVESPT